MSEHPELFEYFELMAIHRLGTLEDFGVHFKSSQNISLWLSYLHEKQRREAEKIKAMFGSENTA